MSIYYIPGNRTHLFSLEANNIPGIPDGMTIDKDDNLWVVCYRGGMVCHDVSIKKRHLKKEVARSVKLAEPF